MYRVLGIISPNSHNNLIMQRGTNGRTRRTVPQKLCSRMFCSFFCVYINLFTNKTSCDSSGLLYILDLRPARENCTHTNTVQMCLPYYRLFGRTTEVITGVDFIYIFHLSYKNVFIYRLCYKTYKGVPCFATHVKTTPIIWCLRFFR